MFNNIVFGEQRHKLFTQRDISYTRLMYLVGFEYCCARCGQCGGELMLTYFDHDKAKPYYFLSYSVLDEGFWRPIEEFLNVSND